VLWSLSHIARCRPYCCCHRKNFGEALVELTQSIKGLELGMLDSNLIKWGVASTLARLAKQTTKPGSGNEGEIACDDGFKALDGDQYVQFRLKILIRKYPTSIPRLSLLKNVEQVAIYVISGATAFIGTVRQPAGLGFLSLVLTLYVIR
jgi:hypothetical protein